MVPHPTDQEARRCASRCGSTPSRTRIGAHDGRLAARFEGVKRRRTLGRLFTPPRARAAYTRSKSAAPTAAWLQRHPPCAPNPPTPNRIQTWSNPGAAGTRLTCCSLAHAQCVSSGLHIRDTALGREEAAAAPPTTMPRAPGSEDGQGDSPVRGRQPTFVSLFPEIP